MAPHPNLWKSILILQSNPCLSLAFCLFLSGFPTKILYTPRLSPQRATCLAHQILLDFITQIKFGEGYRSLSSSLCSFLHSPVSLSLLGPNILPSTLYLISPLPQNLTWSVFSKRLLAQQTVTHIQTKQFNVAAAFWVCIRKVTGSHPGRGTGYTDWHFSHFPSVPTGKYARTVHRSDSDRFLRTTILHSLTNISFDATHCIYPNSGCPASCGTSSKSLQ